MITIFTLMMISDGNDNNHDGTTKIATISSIIDENIPTTDDEGNHSLAR